MKHFFAAVISLCLIATGATAFWQSRDSNYNVSVSGGGTVAPTFSWANAANNTFIQAATINIGSTNQNVACGTINQFDTLVASLQIDGETTDTIIPPAGWIQISTAQNDGANFITYWYKIAGVSETCSYTFSWINSNFLAWTLTNYSGANHTTPIDTSLSGQTATGAGTAIAASSISPASSTDKLVTIFNVHNGNLITADATQTNRTSIIQESSSIASNVSDQTLSSSGATGTRTATGISSQIYFWLMLALKP